MNSDEVDILVADWNRVSPTIDTDPLQIFSRISRLARRLEMYRKEVFAQLGIESWEFDVICAIRKCGDPHELTAGQILQETLVSSGTMTNRIDRLVEHGFVERRLDNTDKRLVLVHLTAIGSEVADNAICALVEREKRLLGLLSDLERKQITNLLRKIGKAVSVWNS